MTVVIQIGNSDDKLPQKEWARFVAAMRECIGGWAKATHFHGGSFPFEVWQNACWIVELLSDQELDQFRDAVSKVGKVFRQDSVAFMTGTVEFI